MDILATGRQRTVTVSGSPGDASRCTTVRPAYAACHRWNRPVLEDPRLNVAYHPSR